VVTKPLDAAVGRLSSEAPYFVIDVPSPFDLTMTCSAITRVRVLWRWVSMTCCLHAAAGAKRQEGIPFAARRIPRLQW
jgi:hypothetical protein